jgi:DNA polymerase V
MYKMTARELGVAIMNDIYRSTGITATCGIGSNLYLAKVALDVTAKHVDDHIGELDEEQYCRTMWNHEPITDFWRIGEGTAKRLQSIGISTMGEIAKADEDMLYKLFGIDAELLIDHAWGRESTLMADIKNYRPQANSLGSGQVLGCDCDFEGGKLLVKEMVDLLCLELVSKGLVTDSITLHINYNKIFEKKPAHGTARMSVTTSSAKKITAYAVQLYERIVDRNTPLRRFSVTFNNVVDEALRQYDLFTSPEEVEREHRLQRAVLDIKDKFGKNAVLKGMNLQEGATTIERNRQIGGHRSGE